MGTVIKPWDHILGTVSIDCSFLSHLSASAVVGELRLPSLKADLHSKYHPDAARPPSLYAECKSIIDGFMWSVQSSPYKYKKEKYTTLLSHCYCLFLCANEGN